MDYDWWSLMTQNWGIFGIFVLLGIFVYWYNKKAPKR